ncbi:hypothetical protein KCP74_02010 [Salmonella enterica subsp. enterica]|nr:hypothetical protein KCP74_02010 [Salmonella enterica subsp. enterica]
MPLGDEFGNNWVNFCGYGEYWWSSRRRYHRGLLPVALYRKGITGRARISPAPHGDPASEGATGCRSGNAAVSQFTAFNRAGFNAAKVSLRLPVGLIRRIGAIRRFCSWRCAYRYGAS